MKGQWLAAVLVLPVVMPVAAQAQTRKLEFAVGAVVGGASSAGSTRAELLGPAGNPVTLFETTHRTSVGVGVDGGVLFRLIPRLALELSGSWTRPDLETTISGDFEGADDTALTLGMHRFSAEVATVRHFGRKGAAEPYVRAGVGWFRELTTDRALVGDGVAAHVGGGLKYWLGNMALRADVRLAVRRGGITLGELRARLSPAVSAGVVFAR